jgi:mannose-6-phosphate isomerase-like protein (cupin superfamily)
MTTTQTNNHQPEVIQESGFNAADLGDFDHLSQYGFYLPPLGRNVEGKVFLKELLGLTDMEVSLNSLPAGGAMPFWHRHQQNEELYLFLSGTGEFWVEETRIPVQEGSVIRVHPEAARIFRNTSKTEELRFIVIQAKENSLTQFTMTDGQGVEKEMPW